MYKRLEIIAEALFYKRVQEKFNFLWPQEFFSGSPPILNNHGNGKHLCMNHRKTRAKHVDSNTSQYVDKLHVTMSRKFSFIRRDVKNVFIMFNFWPL